MTAASTISMSADAVWAVVDRERISLADLLDDLRDDEWEHPSLCVGWTVRDVAAHLALAHTGPGRAAVELLRARGSVDRMIHGTAVRHRPPRHELAATIRAMAGSRRHAPGVSRLEPLLDVLVHGQDITVPLGRVRPVPADAAAVAATRAWTMPFPLDRAFDARRRLAGLQLVATDADWSVGDGERVDGPIAGLLLLLTGRTATALPSLTGPGLARLTA